ncbi:hypothetical protein [uncultured Clostridium sp.]|jgi:hypothetical protein|uniref:hypothetical protein n=1 Tax=uncultured Clostridium sp. TaxID=59620 RepID=UPI002611A7FD|nr:hypothetical protein [uncultured Clostridium sp.]
MRKIVIISKTVTGAKPIPVGDELGINILNPFKKSFARLLKDKLSKEIKENNLDYTIEMDQSYDDLKVLLDNDAHLLLISPLIAKFVDVDDINEFEFYQLTENEYYNTNTENVLAYLKAF